MGKTKNTLPYRLRERAGLPAYRRFWAGGHTSSLAFSRVRRNRQARHSAKQQLHAGQEPEPYRPRNSAAYDAW